MYGLVKSKSCLTATIYGACACPCDFINNFHPAEAARLNGTAAV